MISEYPRPFEERYPCRAEDYQTAELSHELDPTFRPCCGVLWEESHAPSCERYCSTCGGDLDECEDGLIEPPRFCKYPCVACGQPVYWIDLMSPERHHMVRAGACRLLDGTVPLSGRKYPCPNCGHEFWFA